MNTESNVKPIESIVLYKSVTDALADEPPEVFKETVLALMKYGCDGVEPKLVGVAKAIFSLSKPSLDRNMEKLLKKRESSRNAVNTRWEKHRNAIQPNTDVYERIPAHNSDTSSCSSSSSSSCNCSCGGGTSAEGGGTEKPETTTTIFTFLEEAKKAGYTLDEKIAGEILNTGIDPDWVAGPFSFLEYTAGIVRESYPEKPPAEMKKLFISALKWTDRREDYPEWRIRQISAAAAEQERHRKEAARANTPKVCGHCEAPLQPEDRLVCPRCNWTFHFDENTEAYVFEEPIDFSTTFRAFLRNRPGPDEQEQTLAAIPQEEDVEF
ncbi:hypothetical protein AGMMS49944_05440 [Spirochaetia bacterium]|nr:hypothetical protein AGMMS49944_05440 [Spirochaetia bacterium]